MTSWNEIRRAATAFSRRRKVVDACRTFKWHNEAKHNAAVHCVIIGFHACGGDFSNAEKSEFGRHGEEETASTSSASSSASPRLSNLRVKKITLLVPVTRGKTQKLFLRGDASLSISLFSDDFAFGELPSIAAHRLNGWITFPQIATAPVCFHGWNKPTRQVTLARDWSYADGKITKGDWSIVATYDASAAPNAITLGAIESVAGMGYWICGT